MEEQHKIRILYIADQIASVNAGAERQLSQLITNLDRERFEPELIVLRSTAWLREEYYPCPLHSLDLKSIMSFKGLRKFFELRDFIAHGNFHIVQTFFPDSNVIGVLAAHQAGCRVIISSRRDAGFFYNKKLLKATQFANKYVTKFLGNSEIALKEIARIENIDPHKTAVIYNGLDSSRFALSEDKIAEAAKAIHIEGGQKVVGIVANLRPVKDIENFIRASAILVKSHPNLRLVIIGGGDDQRQSQLEQMAEKCGLIGNVIFMGSIDNPLAYMYNFDIGVLCSTSEGLSNTLIEYAACGIPAVATEVGGNSEVVSDKNTGLLVAPKNPEKLAEAIDILLKDDELRNRFGDNARKRAVEKFNLILSIKMHKALYTKLFDEALREDKN